MLSDPEPTQGVPVVGVRRFSMYLLMYLSGALSLGGCVYHFDNPVQALDGGSISGAVALVNAAIEGQSPQGGTVSVLWSGGLTVNLDQSGSFAFLALPDGTYNLSTFVPKPAPNDFDTVSLLAGLVLPVSEGAVDALNLGTVPVQPSGLVTGTVAGGQPGVVVAAFYTVDGGQPTYEGYATTTDGGVYSLLLPAGNHFIAASDSQTSSVLSVTVPAQQTITQDFVLDAGQPSSGGLLEGHLVFGGTGFGASAPASDINQILMGVTYEAFDSQGQLLKAGPLTNTGQGSAGAPFTVLLPAGQPLDLVFHFPTNVSTGEEFKPLVLRGLPFLASQSTYLGQVTWLPVSTFLANGFDAGTGDTLGDGGMPGDGGGGGLAWQQLAFIDAGAGTALTDPVPLPVYLTDGGYGHRLVWVANAGIFAADDSSGSFDAPQPVPGNPPSPGTLIGALTPNLGNLVAWANAQNNVEAAYFSPSGGAPTAVANSFPTPIGTGDQAIALVGGSLNSVAGTFALLTGSPGALPILFTSDYQTFVTLDSQTILEDGGTTTFPVTLNTVAAAPCQVTELEGGSGFCFVSNGSFFDGTTTQSIVFTGVVSTGTPQPFLISLQGLAYVPLTQPVALTTLPPADSELTPVVIAFQGATAQWTQYTTLQTPVTLLPAATPSAPQLLLPYDAPMALSQGMQSGIDTTFMPVSGGPDVVRLDGVHASPLLHGYSDPATGVPIIAVASQFSQPPQLFLYELPFVPDGG